MFSLKLQSIALDSQVWGGLLAGLARDLRLGVRVLRLNPGFAIMAILSLALGIGANTAIFDLIDAVLLRTLPIISPEQLADIHVIHQGRIGSTVGRQQELSSALWDQLRQQQQAFSDLAAWSTERFDLGVGGEAYYANGLWISGSFFDVLQMNPYLGRLLSSSDDYIGCGIQGVVISYAFWQRNFGGRTDALGTKISLNRHPFPIIGVTPANFYGLEVGRNFDVALPLCSEPSLRTEDPWTKRPTTWWLAAIGRLKQGWTFERASTELASIAPGIFTATLPSEYDTIASRNYLRFSFRATPAATGVSPLRKEYEYPLWLLLAISGFVLLIACANLANLMLAKAGARQREMALRMALGASRHRLIRQLLIENLLLAAIGAAVGAGLAQVLSRALVAGISTGQDPVFLSLSPDWRVLAFTAGLTVLTCLLFGVAPALQVAKMDPGAVIRTVGRGLTAGRELYLLRHGLIVCQVALSLILLVSALLFVRTFQNLVNLDAGFQREHILVADFDLSSLNLPVERRLEYKHELLVQVRSTPGVTSAAATSIVPLSGGEWNEFINVPGTAVQRKLVHFDQVTSDYFRTLQMSMLVGRSFVESDTVNSPSVAVVNEAFAKMFLGAVNPVGKTFGVRQGRGKPDKIYYVVGLVADTKYGDLRERFSPIVFVDEGQDAEPDLDATMLIRFDKSLPSLLASLKDTAARNSPEIALTFSVLQTSIRERLGREHLMAALSGVYGLLAVLLSIVGLYGIMSYTVVRRRAEIGIRMALGATRSRILGMIVREALTLVGIGLVLGTILVIAAGHAVQAMLFGLNSTDPLTLALAVMGMLGLAVTASALPAQHATAIQPMQTLREE